MTSRTTEQALVSRNGLKELSGTSAARLLAIPAVLFIGFALLYSWLRSGDLFAVDGAHRCLRVWHEQHIFFDGNNHMLYPVNVLVWTRLLSALGFRANLPLQFYAAVELMNALAAAACLAILFALLSWAGVSRRLALSTAIGYGFSRAFIAHATNSAQPLMGVFWSFLGLGFAVVPFKVKSNWPIVASGFLFSLAMATYQSTIFLAPAAIVLLWRARAQTQSGRAITLPQCLAVLTFASSGLAGCVLIYGWAYRIAGITSLPGMLRRFFVLDGGGVIFGTAWGKVLNLPVGLIRNLFPVLVSYSGIRNLVGGPKTPLVTFLLLLVAVGGLAALGLGQIWKARATLPTSLRTAVVAASVGLAFTTIPLLVYDPSYDKLWLQPLACLALLTAAALYVIRQKPQSRRFVFLLVASLFAIGIASNLAAVTRSHGIKTAGMGDAQYVLETVGRQDFVIGGWDGVSMLYGDIWANDGQFMDFSSEAAWYGRAAMIHLHEAIAKTTENGGRVYFLGLVDESRQTWDGYLGSRCGVPFSDFDYYRSHAHVLREFGIGTYRISFSRLEATGTESPLLGTRAQLGGRLSQQK